ncbi:MAG: hypothetical protein ABI823_04620 [Bryobacteraceae bacterium]
MSSLALVFGLGLAPLAALAVLMYRLRSPIAVSEVTAEWLDSFSIDRYRPMERLLNEADFRFLESLPGYRKEIGARLRKERRVAFRRYLNRLTRDFHRLHAAARQAVAYSETDQSHLVPVLMRQRLQFAWLVTKIDFQLAFHGVGLGKVPVGNLVAAMDAMSRELRMAAVPTAA